MGEAWSSGGPPHLAWVGSAALSSCMPERPASQVRLTAPPSPARQELELLVRLARRDGKLHPAERQMLLTYALGGLDLSLAEARACLQLEAAGPVPPGPVSVAVPRRTLQVMLELALADGALTLNEVSFVERVGVELGLPLEEVRAELAKGRERDAELRDQEALGTPPASPPREGRGGFLRGLLGGVREGLARDGQAVAGRIRRVEPVYVTRTRSGRRETILVRWDAHYTYRWKEHLGVGLFHLRPDRQLEKGTAVWVLVDPQASDRSTLDPRYW